MTLLDRLDNLHRELYSAHTGIGFGVIASSKQGVFLPTDVAGLKVWIDVDDNSTITESGGVISQIDDKSGEGNDLSQATVGLRPLLITAEHNGKDTMRFDGTDDHIERTTFVGGALTQPNTVFIVCTMPSASVETVFDGPTARHLFQRSGTQYQVFAGTLPAAFDTVNTAFAQFNILFNTTASDTRRNKTDLVTGQDVGTNTFNGLILGANDQGNQDAGIDISEYLVYNADVSDSDRDLIETYLANKWGV